MRLKSWYEFSLAKGFLGKSSTDLHSGSEIGVRPFPLGIFLVFTSLLRGGFFIHASCSVALVLDSLGSMEQWCVCIHLTSSQMCTETQPYHLTIFFFYFGITMCIKAPCHLFKSSTTFRCHTIQRSCYMSVLSTNDDVIGLNPHAGYFTSSEQKLCIIVNNSRATELKQSPNCQCEILLTLLGLYFNIYRSII